MKDILIYLTFTIILLIVFTGCSVISTISELKEEPEVMDVAINEYKNDVQVDIILYSDIDITYTILLIEKYEVIIKENYKDRDINIRIIKNKNEIGNYRIERDK